MSDELAAVESAAVEERIRALRTGDLRVAVRGARGKPVAGADVRVEMTRSAFLFGCNCYSLDPGNSEPWQAAYQREFTDLFNYATLPFYWGSFEEERGKPQYDRLETMARWCRDHGIERKGHPLVWHEVWPKWAPTDADEAIPLLRERVLAIIRRYRGLISYWDVLNEANNAADYADRAGEGAWIKRDGAAAAVTAALAWAREAVGSDKATLLYNDFKTGDENARLIGQLRERGALPEAIGIQSHMHSGAWPMNRVWETCERFGVFNRPVHFTEVTVLSSMKKPESVDDVPARRLADDAGGRSGAGGIRRAALRAAVQPSGGGGDHVVGSQRPLRVAECAVGAGARGHVAEAGLREASRSDPRKMVDERGRKERCVGDVFDQRIPRGLPDRRHLRRWPPRGDDRAFFVRHARTDRGEAAVTDCTALPRIARIHADYRRRIGKTGTAVDLVLR